MADSNNDTVSGRKNPLHQRNHANNSYYDNYGNFLRRFNSGNQYSMSSSSRFDSGRRHGASNNYDRSYESAYYQQIYMGYQYPPDRYYSGIFLPEEQDSNHQNISSRGPRRKFRNQSDSNIRTHRSDNNSGPASSRDEIKNDSSVGHRGKSYFRQKYKSSVSKAGDSSTKPSMYDQVMSQLDIKDQVKENDAVSAKTEDFSAVLKSQHLIDDEEEEDFVFKSTNESVVRQNETQRDALIRQLTNSQYECVICFSVIRSQVAIWHCDNCYHVFHLYCIKKWCHSLVTDSANDSVRNSSDSSSTTNQNGASSAANKPNVVKVWRCPSCQKEHSKSDAGFQYLCFCGKEKNPEPKATYTPHSCGEICGKNRGKHCPHPCNILCHPGPCPACEATVTRNCYCGKSQQTLLCKRASQIQCQEVCNRVLNCGQHLCTVVCHKDNCQPCDKQVSQSCFCGQSTRTVLCGSRDSFASSFICSKVCSKRLDCGHHNCTRPCHPGPCDSCKRLPQNVVKCPCNKKTLSDLVPSGGVNGGRTSCVDPIPTCGNKCEKELPLCGHTCSAPCHDTDSCPACPLESEVLCRCGAARKLAPCRQLEELRDSYRCQRRCKKKMSCGIHRCKENCCVSTDHKCALICGKPLSCGLHNCDELCHMGACPVCWQVSFNEMTCECGAQSMLPPIPCGQPPPACDQLCTREHPCEHPVQHVCHSEPNCPPCTVLVSKNCPGGHKVMTNIPCFQPVVTCGLTCGKPLDTCQHSCIRLCHDGPCLSESSSTCTQMCPRPRPSCGHPCNMPCHGQNDCPLESELGRCVEPVQLVCACGQKTQSVPCYTLDGPTKFEKIAAISASTRGEAIDISTLGPGRRNRTIPCDSVCQQISRNEKLAEALNVANPMTQPVLGPPPYAKFLKDYALENMSFLLSVEKSLDDLLKTSKESKHKSRSHNFSPMNRDKRRFIHELTDFYGLESQSYDQEPKRSVTVIAHKGKCYSPAVKLSVMLMKEYPQLSKGQMVMNKPSVLSMNDTLNSLPSTMQKLGRNNLTLHSATQNSAVNVKPSQPPPLLSQASKESTKSNEEVEFDYFDMKPSS